MRQVHQGLAHVVVQRDGVRVFEVLSNEAAVVVFGHQHLFRTRHSLDDGHANLGEYRCIDLAARRLVDRAAGEHQRSRDGRRATGLVEQV